MLLRKNFGHCWAMGLAAAVGLAVWAHGLPAAAQAKRVASQEVPAPTYPHINLATGYQVEPGWPHPPTNISWGDACGLAVDSRDFVYMFTRAKPPVQIYDPSGKFVRGWGDDVIQKAHGLRVDPKGNVWLTDVGNHTVREFTPEGKLLRTLGTPGESGEDATHFYMPTDLTFGANGDLFITDGYGNNRVVHLDANGKLIKTWGKLGSKPGEFSLPHAIVRDSKGRLYVADRNNARVQVFEESGTFVDQWRDLLVPWGLCLLANDEILACGSSPMQWIGNQRCLGCPPKDQVIMRLSPSGKVLAQWTFPLGVEGQEKPGELDWLHNAVVDSHGDLYVTDIKGKRLQKFVKQSAE